MRFWPQAALTVLALLHALSTAAAQPLITGYWADWTADQLPPENIDFKRFDIINFAFGLPTSSFDLAFNSPASTDLLQRLVNAAAAAKTGTRVVLSIGGWRSSQYFSAAVATETSRTTFAQNIYKALQQYKLDGADLDWEYPGSAGAGNPFSPSDAANLNAFLAALRTTLGPQAIITVTASYEPWTDASGGPMADVSPTARSIDAILLMAYDANIGGVGVNAPLADLCGNSTQPRANAAAGVKQWVAAGMPRDKILLGVPAYGYIQASTLRTLPQRRADEAADVLPRRSRPRASYPPPPDAAPPSAASDDARSAGPAEARGGLPHPLPLQNQIHEAYAAAGYAPSRRTVQIKRQTAEAGGPINFASLVAQGLLVPAPVPAPAPAADTDNSAPKTTTYLASPTSGYTRHWDLCSDTPYLVNGQRLLTYDDPQSLRDKAEFARRAGLAGVGVWSVEADTEDGALVGALARGLGR